VQCFFQTAKIDLHQDYKIKLIYLFNRFLFLEKDQLFLCSQAYFNDLLYKYNKCVGKIETQKNKDWFLRLG
jgi:hypothetical protein